MSSGPARVQHEILWRAAVAVLIGLLAAAAVAFSYAEHRASEAAHIEAIAHLRSDQIAAWLGERVARARFASGSAYFADLVDAMRAALAAIGLVAPAQEE